mmetsp:Transcript_1342/g.5328  ORF Transcript_1342/g.5328 Transcript_1342/m.5328 type:complete len:275 (-) Transcript_1342:1306-2130(-)
MHAGRPAFRVGARAIPPPQAERAEHRPTHPLHGPLHHLLRPGAEERHEQLIGRREHCVGERGRVGVVNDTPQGLALPRAQQLGAEVTRPAARGVEARLCRVGVIIRQGNRWSVRSVGAPPRHDHLLRRGGFHGHCEQALPLNAPVVVHQHLAQDFAPARRARAERAPQRVGESGLVHVARWVQPLREAVERRQRPNDEHEVRRERHPVLQRQVGQRVDNIAERRHARAASFREHLLFERLEVLWEGDLLPLARPQPSRSAPVVVDPNGRLLEQL